MKKVELADGSTRWRIRVYMGRDPETDKRKYVTKTFDLKRDADKEATRLERQKDLGILTVPSKESFGKYLQTWLDEVKEGTIRARTMHDYRGYIRRYIKKPPDGTPSVGSIRIDRLTPAAFQALYAHMRTELDLSPRTIRYLHTILRQALGHAVATGAIARNPTDYVELPKAQGKKNKTHRAMSREEATAFLEAAREDRYYPLWAVLLTGGLRPGEAFGLKWGDVDLEEGRIHIRRALTRRGFEDSWRLVEPKTARARRVVVLPPVTVEALREWKVKQAEERLLLGAEYDDHGGDPFVFATEFGKPLDQSNLRANHFLPVMAAAGLGEWEGEGKDRTFTPAYRVYDLRHTCATLLLLAGENPKIVSERLGHASVSLTLDTYSHVLPSMQESSAEKLEAMFGADVG